VVTKVANLSTPKTRDYFMAITVETIEKLRRGEIKAVEANAIAKQVGYTLQKAKIQLEILKFQGKATKAQIASITV